MLAAALAAIAGVRTDAWHEPVPYRTGVPTRHNKLHQHCRLVFDFVSAAENKDCNEQGMYHAWVKSWYGD